MGRPGLTERWAVIDIAPRYDVSSHGLVRSRVGAQTRTLRPARGGKGRYLQVTLCVGADTHCRRIHRLMLTAFVGPCPPGRQAAHLNGDKYDNRIDNLAWVTPGENNNQRIGHGTMPRKFSPGQIRSIRATARNVGFRETARRYSVSHSTIADIVHERTYRDV